MEVFLLFDLSLHSTEYFSPPFHLLHSSRSLFWIKWSDIIAKTFYTFLWAFCTPAAAACCLPDSGSHWNLAYEARRYLLDSHMNFARTHMARSDAPKTTTPVYGCNSLRNWYVAFLFYRSPYKRICRFFRLFFSLSARFFFINIANVDNPNLHFDYRYYCFWHP